MKPPEKPWETIETLAEKWGCSKADVEIYLAAYEPDNKRMLDAEYREYPNAGYLDPHEEAKVRGLVIHPYPRGRFPRGEVVIMRKEVLRFERKHFGESAAICLNPDQKPVEPPTTEPLFDIKEYVEQNRGKMSEEQIIYELRGKGVHNNDIGVAFGGTYRKGNNALAMSISKRYNRYKKKLEG